MSKFDLLSEAKLRLPLTRLMELLGHGDRARKSARCGFHADSSASLSIFIGSNGEPRWKCHARCGEPSQGDAIDYLARAHNLSNADACREFIRLAGIATSPPPTSPPRPAPAPRRLLLPALRVGSDAELGALARLRRLGVDGLRLASARGLVRFGQWRNRAAWFVTDETGLNAQVRRLDGQPWPQGCKALTLPGARAAWPLARISHKPSARSARMTDWTGLRWAFWGTGDFDSVLK